MAEVYAALSEYTDVQIGRVIDYLEESDSSTNTLIFYCADNGAASKAAPAGRSTRTGSSMAIPTTPSPIWP